MNQQDESNNQIRVEKPITVENSSSSENNNKTQNEENKKNKEGKKINKLLFIALGLLFVFVAILILVLLLNLDRNKPQPTNPSQANNSSQNSSDSNLLPLPTEEVKIIESSCLALNMEEIEKILPEEANNKEKYNLRIRDYSPNKCHLAINIDYPVGANRHQLIQENDYPLVGLWIVNTSNKKANKLLSDNRDYLFDAWINDRMISVIGEFGNTITTHNIETSSVVKRELNKINFLFNDNEFDQMVEFQTLKGIDYCDFSKMTENNWVQYDFSCIQESDVIVKIPGYKEMLIQYAARDAIRIDNILYSDLLEKDRWNITL